LEADQELDEEECHIINIIEDVMMQFSQHGFNLDKVASIMIQTGTFYFEERVKEGVKH
jgi:hypothetical protein